MKQLNSLSKLKPIWAISALALLGAVFLTAAIVLGRVGYFSVWGNQPLVYQAIDNLAEGADLSSYLLQKTDQNLPLTANAYLVVDLETNEAIIKKNETKIFPIASVSKLVTALVALDVLKPEQTITVSPRAWETFGNSAKLKLGQTMPLQVALYPLLLSSSNDIAEAIAETYGRERFIKRMNKTVKEIGMVRTSFADPSGLSPENVSTSADLAKLANYIYKNKPEILAITREQQYSYNKQTWKNINDISLMSHYLGGKNGYTEEANRTLVSLFDIPLATATSSYQSNKELKNRLLAVVLLQSDNKKKDAGQIINYLAHYVRYTGINGFIPLKVISPKT